jgi:cell division septum initiation protein DivIVA
MVLMDAETVARAESMRDQAKEIKVNDQDSANLAGEMSKELRGLSNLINKTREQIKKAPLELCRQIDAAAKEAMGPLADGAEHLDRQVSAWMQEQNRIRKEAEAVESRRRAEIEAKEARARQEAFKKEAEEQTARIAAEEAAQKALEAKTGKAKKAAEEAARKAEAELAALTAEREEMERKAQEAEMVTQLAIPAAIQTAPKVSGYREEEDVTFDIPDYAKIPTAMLQAVLMPDKKTIDSWLKSGKLNEANAGTWLIITRQKKAARSR